MLKSRAYLFAAVLSLFLSAPIWAQSTGSQGQSAPAQQPSQPEKPLQPATPKDQNQNRPALSPDDAPPVAPVVAGTVYNAPLTGANEPPFSIFSSRSYVVPAVEFFGQLDSNGHNTPFGNFASINSILGAISIQKMARASQYNVDYMVGRTFSNEGNAFNSTINDFNGSYLWSRGRWDGFVADRLLYSSESSFLGGFAPFQIPSYGSIGGFGMAPLLLRNSFLPSEGIFTNFGPRLTNVAIAQLNNHITRRTFFTLVANDDILHFLHSGLIDSSTAGFQTGLGYQRSHEDAIAVIYRFSDLWFSGFPVTVRDNIIEFAYQRQIAERWRFQVGAGPDFSYIHAPSTVTGETTANTTRDSWAADVSLHYRMRRTALSAGYGHYLTAGGGVFLGSITNAFYGNATHELSRVWRLNFNASYDHNKNLIPLPAGVTGIFAPANGTYNSFYGSFEARRRVGRDSEVFLGYLARYQTSNYTLCQTTRSVCLGPSVVGHQFNFGFLWRVRPIPIG